MAWKIHSHAKDYIDHAPDILRGIEDPHSNLVLLKRNASDLPQGLEAYLETIRKAHAYNPADFASMENEFSAHDPEKRPAENIKIALKNRETITLSVDKALLVPGFGSLATDIGNIGNQIIAQTSRPVTFLPNAYGGKGYASLRFFTPQWILHSKQTDDGTLFRTHLDGAGDDSEAGLSRQEPPPIPFTALVPYLAQDTVGLKDYATREVAEKFLDGHQSLADTAAKIERERGSQIYQSFGRYSVGLFARMTLEESRLAPTQPRTVLENTRHVLLPHKMPFLDEKQGARLILALHGWIGVPPITNG